MVAFYGCEDGGDASLTSVEGSESASSPTPGEAGGESGVITEGGGQVIDPCEDLSCDDENLCTIDSCDLGTCVHEPEPGQSCDDGNLCSTDDTCDEKGQCSGSGTLLCEDDSSCTEDICDSLLGCVFTPEENGILCSDGNACTLGDTCAGGLCQGIEQECEDDGSPCTVSGGCDTESGECLHIQVPAGTSCDDDNACTADDMCQGEACVPSGETVCFDGNVCTDDSCTPKGGCVFSPNVDFCDDGDACTLSDKCQNGQCYGQDLLCNDDNPCTDDSCDTAGGCIYLNVPIPCTDDNSCTVGDTCLEGSCLSGNVKSCDDSNACTNDSCNVSDGTCNHVNNTNSCQDGNACTENDLCQLGSCVGIGVSCFDGNPCTSESCDNNTGCTFASVTGTCDDGDSCTKNTLCMDNACVGQPVNCDDDNPCTTDSCDADTGCKQSNALGLECDDGNACTELDYCLQGVCNPGTEAFCDDGNVCTTDSCHPIFGCQHQNNLSECDDGDACTSNDKCSLGTCVGSGGVNCDDGNVCTTDACTASGGCVNTPSEGACTDGNACTEGDSCVSGACVSGATPDCDDGNPCTTDNCAAGQGCVNTANSLPCNDANACTLGDVCSDKVCTSGEALPCDDDNVCTADACDPATGCTTLNLITPCDDGNACSLGDNCASGLCVAGAIKSCDDGNPCTSDACDADSGCEYTNLATVACDDGDTCSTGDYCQGGVCNPGNDVSCDDNNPCTTESCNPVLGCQNINNTNACDDGNECTSVDACNGGTCVGQGTNTCDDGIPCTTDSCSDTEGCIHAPADTLCDDGNSCTINTCVASVGCSTNNTAGALCDDGDVCNTQDYCQDGDCQGGGAISCDDGILCTTDSCNPVLGCQTSNNSLSCDDGNVCSVVDECQGGVCVGAGSNACDDGIPCTVDSCSDDGGCTHTPSSSLCDDGNTCTLNTCLEGIGCSVADKAGTLCDDGDICNTQDYCQDGECQGGTTVECDDGNTCTTDSCNPAVGCQNVNNSVGCDDGNVCTVGDICFGGSCSAGANNSCNDGVPCTADSCDPVEGCLHIADNTACDDGNICTINTCLSAIGCSAANSAGTLCDDGDACNTNDYCQEGECTGGSPVNCEDGNSCTSDSCNPVLGCQNNNNSEGCDDGDPCTEGDTCVGGSCASGLTTNCDDGISCTTESCDPIQGCLHAVDNTLCEDDNVCSNNVCNLEAGCVFPPANGVVCDDDSACTSSDVCFGGACTGQGVTCDDGDICNGTETCAPAFGCEFGTALSCGDGNSCTTDSCDPVEGCTYVLNTADCSDGNLCTTGDQCVSGACVGQEPLGCSDGNFCTDDGCDTENGCTHEANTAPCNDGNACTEGDVCDGASCKAGAGVTCDDSNPCTSDVCDSEMGCMYTDNTSPCNDGNACSTGDVCSEGVCVSGADTCECQTSADCTDDGDACNGTSFCDTATFTCKTIPGTEVICSPLNDSLCSANTCVPETGQCMMLPASVGAPCDDEDVCTVGETCTATGECGDSGTISCDDGNDCTDDSCSPESGCVYTNNAAACDDGDPCTLVDSCGNSTCSGVGTLNCDDGNSCTENTCAEGLGCSYPAQSGSCDDGNPCSLGDLCVGGACNPGPESLICDDGDACTDDYCDATEGCSSIPSPNSAPSIALVTITATNPPAKGDSELTCSWSGYADDDGDADSSTWVWLVGGIEVASGGTLSGVFAKGQTVTCEVTPSDGCATGTLKSADMAITNSAPSVTGVEIVVASGTGPVTQDTDVTCVPLNYFDLDGDESQSTVLWSVNDAVVGNATVLSAAFFGKDDTVKCTLTPFDGEAVGTPVNTTIEVGNTPPVASNGTITPNPAYTDSVLSCTADTVDDDGDVVILDAAWSINNAPFTGIPGPADYSKTDLLTCELTPTDGTDSGTPVSAEITISNKPPVVEESSIAISPSSPSPGQTLSCSYTFSDADGDADLSTIEWLVSGSVEGSGSVFTGSYTSSDVVVCRITPFDGSDSGDVVQKSVGVIQNSPPSATSVVIQPDTPTSGDELSALVVGWFDPEGDPEGYLYEWFVAGIPAGEEATLPAGTATKGQTVLVKVYPYDGSLQGTVLFSPAVIIANAGPTAPGVSVGPEGASTNDDLVCTPDAVATDPDGDAVTTTYTWSKDGVVVPESEGLQTLPANLVTAGEWTCSVTVTDNFLSDSATSLGFTPCTVQTFYVDIDVDGFGSDSQTIEACEQPNGYVTNADDCVDSDENVYPGAAINDDLALCTKDTDGDGYGDNEPGEGIDPGTDCDDGDPDTSPGAEELCDDGADNDCDGLVDGGTADGDGDGYTLCEGDCDDTNPMKSPGQPELCGDGIDNDCDGTVDVTDVDGDGYGGCAGGPDCNDWSDWVYPGAEEMIGDGLDNNCDGVVDSLTTDDDKDGYSEAAGDCDDAKAWIHPLATDIPDNGIDEDCNTVDATALGDHPNAVYVNPSPAAAAASAANDFYPGTPTLPLATIAGAIQLATLSGQDIFVAEGDTTMPTLGLTMSIYGGYEIDPVTNLVNWGTVSGRTDFVGDVTFSPGTTRETVASRFDVVGRVRFNSSSSAILHDSSVRMNEDDMTGSDGTIYKETIVSESGQPLLAHVRAEGHDFGYDNNATTVRPGDGGIEIHFSEIRGGVPGGSGRNVVVVGQYDSSNGEEGYGGMATCADGTVEAGAGTWKRSDMAWCQTAPGQTSGAADCGPGSHQCTSAEISARWDQREAPATTFVGDIQGSGSEGAISSHIVDCQGIFIQSDGTTKCYQAFTNTLNWTNSQSACQSWGGHLLVTKSQEEWQFVYDNILGANHSYIGLYQNTGCSSNGCNDDKWRYNWQGDGGGNSESTPYAPWQSGQPAANSGDSWAVFMHYKYNGTASGKLYNCDDDDVRSRICEKVLFHGKNQEIGYIELEGQIVSNNNPTNGGYGGTMCCTDGPSSPSNHANPEQLSEITNSLIAGGRAATGAPGGNMTLVLGGERIVGSLLMGGTPGVGSGAGQLAGTWEGARKVMSLLSTRIVQDGKATGTPTANGMPAVDLARQTPDFACEELLFEGHTYRVCNTYTRTWAEAKDSCRDWGGYLATVDSPEENAAVGAMIDGNAWLGYTDTQSEGTFAWDGGPTASYDEYWTPGAPNTDGANDEDCVVIQSNDDKWNDQPCINNNRYICEKDYIVPTNSVMDCAHSEFEGKQYALCSAQMAQGGEPSTQFGKTSWYNAQSRCESWGGALAVMDTGEETTYAAGLLSGSTYITNEAGECVRLLSDENTSVQLCTNLYNFLCERTAGYGTGEVEVMATGVSMEAGQSIELTRIELGSANSPWGFAGILADSATDNSIIFNVVHITSPKRAVGVWITGGTVAGNEIVLKTGTDSTGLIHHDATLASYNNTVVLGDQVGAAIQLSGETSGIVNTLMTTPVNGACVRDHSHDSAKSVMLGNLYDGCGGKVYTGEGFYFQVPALLTFQSIFPNVDAGFSSGVPANYSSALLWLYDLLSTSTAIDAGVDPTVWGLTNLPAHDAKRLPRNAGSALDMGANEYQP